MFKTWVGGIWACLYLTLSVFPVRRSRLRCHWLRALSVCLSTLAVQNFLHLYSRHRQADRWQPAWLTQRTANWNSFLAFSHISTGNSWKLYFSLYNNHKVIKPMKNCMIKSLKYFILASSSLNQDRLSAVSTNQYSLAPPLIRLMLLMVNQPLRITWGARKGVKGLGSWYIRNFERFSGPLKSRKSR